MHYNIEYNIIIYYLLILMFNSIMNYNSIIVQIHTTIGKKLRSYTTS